MSAAANSSVYKTSFLRRWEMGEETAVYLQHIITNRRANNLFRRQLTGTQQGSNLLTDAGIHLMQRSHKISKKANRVIIGRIEPNLVEVCRAVEKHLVGRGPE